ncbi:MAG: recombinase family protein [Pseudobdellovibrionaceae bacterium]|nr:recombinase family protein [Pseudobdellovibrionaceae bacterium]
MATFGYLRVSTIDQNIENCKNDILRFANDRKIGTVMFVEEIVSGTVSWKKRKLSEILNSMIPGDSLIVSELSRLGRSMLECMEILSFALNNKICVYALKGDWKLDHSIQSKIIAMTFSMAAEIERDLISKRTKEALLARKEKGLKLGRPIGPGKSKLDKHRTKIEELLTNGSTQKFIANKYRTTEANLHNWLKKNQIQRPTISP